MNLSSNAQSFFHDRLIKIIFPYVEQKNQILKKNNKQPIVDGLVDSVESMVDESVLYGDRPAVILSNQRCDALNLKSNIKIFSIPDSWYGIYYDEEALIYDQVPITKDYNCLLNRLDPLRQAMFYELIKNNLLYQGHVSMNLHIGNITPGYETNDPIELFKLMYHSYNNSFEDINDFALSIVPYRSFSPEENLYSITNSTKLSVVAESFPHARAITFSEKVFRALQTPRPFLLFNQNGSVEKLRQMGFDVFDDVVDHSYDLLPTHESAIPRMTEIMSQLKNLVNLPVDQNTLDHWQKKCYHNRQVLRELNLTTLQDTISTIDCAFEYSMSLL